MVDDGGDGGGGKVAVEFVGRIQSGLIYMRIFGELGFRQILN